MSMIVRTLQCYPMVFNMGGGLVFDARDADHERCPGGHTIKGVLGGWWCPCPCHREVPRIDGTVDASGRSDVANDHD